MLVDPLLRKDDRIYVDRTYVEFHHVVWIRKNEKGKQGLTLMIPLSFFYSMQFSLFSQLTDELSKEYSLGKEVRI